MKSRLLLVLLPPCHPSQHFHLLPVMVDIPLKGGKVSLASLIINTD